jgi:PAS domain S-box-containing protein
MNHKILSKSQIFNQVWKPSILAWLIGILSVLFMVIASGKVIEMFGETDPFIKQLSNLKEKITESQIDYLQFGKDAIKDNSGEFNFLEKYNINQIISSINSIDRSKLRTTLKNKNQEKNLDKLINELQSFGLYHSDDNNQIVQSFQNANTLIDQILYDLKDKQLEDYERFRLFRIIIIIVISTLFIFMGIILLSFNKKKVLDYNRIQTTLSKVEEQKIHLENLINSTPAAIAVLDTNDIVKRINAKFTKLFGFTESQVIGKKISDLIVPKELIVESQLLSDESNLRKGMSEKITLRKHKDGHLINVLVIGSAILIDDKFEGVYGIYQDISERMKHEEELLKSKEIAENADKLKSVFLAQMSHEIRTPINAMVSLASLLRDDLTEKVDEDHKLSLELINKAGNRIIRTVDLLLNLSELQAGTYQTIFKTFDIYTDVLSKLIVGYKKLALEKNIDLSVKVQTRETEINADSYTVNQIFAQLIDNAVKYTEKGTIKITLSRNEKNNLIVEVADTGIGISDDYLPNLFEPFSQEEMGYSRKYEGNGIGLTLVKKYCDLNRATIEVESEKNKGSVFRVIFFDKKMT